MSVRPAARDVERLDRWGVIPQVIAVAWIEDNYKAAIKRCKIEGWTIKPNDRPARRLELKL